ncbi:acyltransferase [Spirosoma radiotolerans]|uniref:Acetyltransferase n=1 Tax=Spirosoma radiotolerans TaxID=1379870 RepID=A0A0E3V6N7_9BACT|nr:acyltransferase [Spirosoma radiotolerans]AKD55182.1 acetyltransferase [Spirosoma radiotolerans]
MSFKSYIDERPALKQFVHWLLIPHNQARPRRWVSWFVNPFVHKQHRSSIIRSSVRMDVLPFNAFSLGAHSIIDDFGVINNGVGPVQIGENTLIGIGAVVIGPVKIGSKVIMAQHVVLSGLNHSYENVQLPIRDQRVTMRPIVIEDECWIGANVTITAGVTVGRHSVVAGGSVVTRDVPAYTVVGGNPARVLKHYDKETDQWLKGAGTAPTLVPAA